MQGNIHFVRVNAKQIEMLDGCSMSCKVLCPFIDCDMFVKCKAKMYISSYTRRNHTKGFRRPRWSITRFQKHFQSHLIVETPEIAPTTDTPVDADNESMYGMSQMDQSTDPSADLGSSSSEDLPKKIRRTIVLPLSDTE